MALSASIVEAGGVPPLGWRGLYLGRSRAKLAGIGGASRTSFMCGWVSLAEIAATRSLSVPARSAFVGLVGARVVGAPAGLATSEAMPPVTCQRRGFTTTAAHNRSIDTDPQQQKAASPQVLVVRSFLRDEALASRASEGKGNTSSRLR